MHTIKITPNLLFEYQCTSGQIYQIAESNRIETFFARIGMLYWCPIVAVIWNVSVPVR